MRFSSRILCKPILITIHLIKLCIDSIIPFIIMKLMNMAIVKDTVNQSALDFVEKSIIGRVPLNTCLYC